MHRLLDEVLEMADDRIRLKSITVRKDFAVEDKQIMMDKAKIMIALTNIVINAIDAMSSENGELRLTESLVDGHYCLQIGTTAVASLRSISSRSSNPILPVNQAAWALDCQRPGKSFRSTISK